MAAQIWGIKRSDCLCRWKSPPIGELHLQAVRLRVPKHIVGTSRLDCARHAQRKYYSKDTKRAPNRALSTGFSRSAKFMIEINGFLYVADWTRWIHDYKAVI